VRRHPRLAPVLRRHRLVRSWPRPPPPPLLAATLRKATAGSSPSLLQSARSVGSGRWPSASAHGWQQLSLTVACRHRHPFRRSCSPRPPPLRPPGPKRLPGRASKCARSPAGARVARPLRHSMGSQTGRPVRPCVLRRPRVHSSPPADPHSLPILPVSLPHRRPPTLPLVLVLPLGPVLLVLATAGHVSLDDNDCRWRVGQRAADATSTGASVTDAVGWRARWRAA
jgi:hypothetical protein